MVPEDVVRLRERAVVLGAREAEVDEPQAQVAAADHVRRLHVAVDEADRVDLLEGRADLVDDPRHLAVGERPALDRGRERLAGDVLHGAEEAVAVAARLEEARHPGRGERAERIALAPEARECLGVGAAQSPGSRTLSAIGSRRGSRAETAR